MRVDGSNTPPLNFDKPKGNEVSHGKEESKKSKENAEKFVPWKTQRQRPEKGGAQHHADESSQR